MTMLKAEVYPGADGWRWRARGLNGEILASGEAYVHRTDAENVLRILFNRHLSVDVAVRNHGNEVVANYTLPLRPEPLDEVYGGQLDDVLEAHDEIGYGDGG